MSRKRMLLRLLVKAAWVRKDRALTALVSIAVVATMATVALTVYSDLEGKFSREFRSFGPNAIITASNGLNTGNLELIRAKAGSTTEVVPVGYAIAQGPDGSPVVVGGTDLAAFRQLNSSWSMDSAADRDALVGFRAAAALSPQGTPFQITYGGRVIQVKLFAIFHSGSEDDSRIYIGLPQFLYLTQTLPNTAQLRIAGTSAGIEQQISGLAASLPQMEVKPLRQITEAQAAVLPKTRSIVLAASAVVVVLIVVCMVATLTGSVLERRKDFAVMKALGASNRAVHLLFAGEAILISLVGALVGFIAGTAIAFWIGKANFGAIIPPRLDLLVPVLLGSMLLALIASAAPLRLLRRIQPARMLRGE